MELLGKTSGLYTLLGLLEYLGKLLPILLEVNTLGHALCAFVICVCVGGRNLWILRS